MASRFHPLVVSFPASLPDRRCIPSGSSGNVAWELFYGIAVPTSLWQRVGSFVWFALDMIFFTAIVIYGNFEGRRRDHATSVRVLALVFLLAPCKVTESCSDDGQQMTAYWSGVLLQLPAGWITIFPIWRTRDVGVNKQRDLVGIPGSP